MTLLYKFPEEATHHGRNNTIQYNTNVLYFISTIVHSYECPTNAGRANKVFSYYTTDIDYTNCVATQNKLNYKDSHETYCSLYMSHTIKVYFCTNSTSKGTSEDSVTAPSWLWGKSIHDNGIPEQLYIYKNVYIYISTHFYLLSFCAFPNFNTPMQVFTI